jgi:hypothetical protein
MIVVLTFALLLPAVAHAADDRVGPSGPAVGTTAPSHGPLAAAARDAGRTAIQPERATSWAPSPARRQVAEQRGNRRSWIGRHPALFGALAGAGGGALVGSVAGHPESDEWFSRREGFVAFGASAGAAGGALVGWIAGIVRD